MYLRVSLFKYFRWEHVYLFTKTTQNTRFVLTLFDQLSYYLRKSGMSVYHTPPTHANVDIVLRSVTFRNAIAIESHVSPLCVHIPTSLYHFSVGKYIHTGLGEKELDNIKMVVVKYLNRIKTYNKHLDFRFRECFKSNFRAYTRKKL